MASAWLQSVIGRNAQRRILFCFFLPAPKIGEKETSVKTSKCCAIPNQDAAVATPPAAVRCYVAHASAAFSVWVGARYTLRPNKECTNTTSRFGRFWRTRRQSRLASHSGELSDDRAPPLLPSNLSSYLWRPHPRTSAELQVTWLTWLSFAPTRPSVIRLITDHRQSRLG